MDSTNEIIFRTVVDTGNSEQTVNKLNKSIKETDSSVEKMGNSFEQSLADIDKKVNSGELTFRQLNKAVKEYQSIAIQAGRESAIGQEALQRAAALSDELGDLNNEMKALAHDGANMQAALQLGSTVTAGYGAMQGAMALVGNESEELQETFVKLQAVQSVLAGIEQVRANLEKESFLMIKAKSIATKAMTVIETVYAVAVGTTTGAMKALRIAMLALPIVAIIAGVAALIGWLVSLTGSGEDLEAQNDALTDSFERNTAAMNENQKTLERQIDNQRKLAEAQGASAEELLKIDQKKLAVQETGRKREMKSITNHMNKQIELYKKAYVDEDFELAKKIREEYVKNKERYKQLQNLNGQYQVDLKLLNLKYKNEQQKEEEKADKEVAEAQKRRNEQARERQKQHQQRLLEERRLYEDLLANNIADEDLRKLTQLRLQHERELQEVVSKYGKQSKVIAELEKKQAEERKSLLEEFAVNEKALKESHDRATQDQEKAAQDVAIRSKRAELETRLMILKDDFEAQQKVKADLAKLERDEALMNESLTMSERFKIEMEYQTKLDALREETANKEKERRKQLEQAAISVTEKGLSSIQSLSDAVFANKMNKLEKGSAAEEKAARKQFQINKALQLGAAIMDGYKAISASLAQSPIAIGPAPNPVGIASLAFASVTTAANIAKIAASRFEGGGSGSDIASTATSVAAPSVPDFSQTTQTAGLQGSGTEQTGITTKPTFKLNLVDSELKTKLKDSAKAEAVSSVG